MRVNVAGRLCIGCSRWFVPLYGNTGNRYCTPHCWRTAGRIPIGTEKLKMTRRGNHLEWHVKVRQGTKQDWKRKAVVLLEQVLHRQLSSTECQRIIFVDGDKTNCRVGNLLLLDPRLKIGTCTGCGRGWRSEGDRRKTNLCQSCWAKECGKTVLNTVQKVRSLSFTECRLVRGILNRPLERGDIRDIARWFFVAVSVIHHIKSMRSYPEVSAMAEKEVWKALLDQHDKLVRAGTVNIYDRVTLLKRVYEDPHFLDDQRKTGKSPIEALDMRVRDTCANFTELLQVLKLFPRRKQWETGDLYSMRVKMLDILRMKQRVTKGEKDAGQGQKEDRLNGDRRLSWKQKYLELEAKYKQLESAHKQLEKDYQEMRKALIGKAS